MFERLTGTGKIGRSIAKLCDLFSERRLEEVFGGTFDAAVERPRQLDDIQYSRD